MSSKSSHFGGFMLIASYLDSKFLCAIILDDNRVRIQLRNSYVDYPRRDSSLLLLKPDT